jgi:hypothetical protein
MVKRLHTLLEMVTQEEERKRDGERESKGPLVPLFSFPIPRHPSSPPF